TGRRPGQAGTRDHLPCCAGAVRRLLVTVAGRDPATPPNRKPAKSCQQGQPIPRCPPPLAHAEVDARGHPTPGGRRRFLPLLEVCVDRAIRLAVAAASAAVVFLGMWM